MVVLAGIEPMDRLGTLLVGAMVFLSPRLYDLTITWLFVACSCWWGAPS